MLHKEFWGLLFLAFVGWIFVASNPNDRIEHFCKPVAWLGNISTSATAMVVPAQQVTVQSWFDKFEYGCRYMTWRLIYQADYNKAMGITTPTQTLSADMATPAPIAAGGTEKPTPAPDTAGAK